MGRRGASGFRSESEGRKMPDGFSVRLCRCPRISFRLPAILGFAGRMRRLLCSLLPGLIALPVLAGTSPRDLLPPAPPWHGASEALIAKPDDPWITPAEKTGLTDTPNYEDTI